MEKKSQSQQVLFKNILRGAWVAQSVKRPTSAQVMISRSVSSSPASGSVLTAQSLEPVSDSVSPSLSDPPPFMLCLCLKINKRLKKIKKKKIHFHCRRLKSQTVASTLSSESWLSISWIFILIWKRRQEELVLWASLHRSIPNTLILINLYKLVIQTLWEHSPSPHYPF